MNNAPTWIAGEQPGYKGVLSFPSGNAFLALISEDATRVPVSYRLPAGLAGSSVVLIRGGWIGIGYGFISRFDWTASDTAIHAVANAGSTYLAKGIAPGETVLVQGQGFDASAQLYFDGTPAPMLNVESGMLRAIVPWRILSPQVEMVLRQQGEIVQTALLTAADADPTIISCQNADGTLNGEKTPAEVNSLVGGANGYHAGNQ